MRVMHVFDAGPTTDLPRPVEISLDFAQPITAEFHLTHHRHHLQCAVSFFPWPASSFHTCQFNQLQVSTKGQNSGQQAITKVIARLHATIQPSP